MSIHNPNPSPPEGKLSPLIRDLQKLIASIRLPTPAELARQSVDWLRLNWRWWGVSLGGHAVGLILVMLVLSAVTIPLRTAPPTFEGFDNTVPELAQLDFNLETAPLDPAELSTDTLLLTEPPAQAAQYNDDSKIFEATGGGNASALNTLPFGGLGGFDTDAQGAGPTTQGAGGVGSGVGESNSGGSGGAGIGFGSRGKGMREALLGSGGTKASERSVAAALHWLARHQNPNGSWSIDHRYRCKDDTCTGPGSTESDAGATALALLPFLAAGQTSESDGPYQKNIRAGIAWMLSHQVKSGDMTGDLSAGSGQVMYSHGLAAIMLCEAYGMTRDPATGKAAQAAVRFIERAQNKRTGGWRYVPGQPGDTSVFGWQLMALKSAQMAGLQVNYETFQAAERWLQSVASGKDKGLYCYLGERQETPSMTAVGLLCSQYMGTRPNAPSMVEGMAYLMDHSPALAERDVYYWYYATQVMHNVPGPEWDTWNRAMRRMLIETQIKEGCAAGSWDPEKPVEDAWGNAGGRLMMTSLSALTLEVYYRYLPLYQLDAPTKLKLDRTAAEREQASVLNQPIHANRVPDSAVNGSG